LAPTPVGAAHDAARAPDREFNLSRSYNCWKNAKASAASLGCDDFAFVELATAWARQQLAMIRPSLPRYAPLSTP